jgi:hypothetical protein
MLMITERVTIPSVVSPPGGSATLSVDRPRMVLSVSLFLEQG